VNVGFILAPYFFYARNYRKNTTDLQILYAEELFPRDENETRQPPLLRIALFARIALKCGEQSHKNEHKLNLEKTDWEL
jgi:hypothetical protein